MKVDKIAIVLSVAIASFTFAGSGIAEAPPAHAQGKAACAKGSPGGEWRSYGGDLQNTRHQPKEKDIGVDNAIDLAPTFRFSTTSAGADGAFQSPPVIADGCVYASTSTGWVFALNADTAEVVWATQATDGTGGDVGSTYSPSVFDGRVYLAGQNSEGPVAFALDQDTGELVWATKPLRKAILYGGASVVVHDGLVFVGLSGGEGGGQPGRIEGDPNMRGSYALIDAKSGNVLKHEWVIPDSDSPPYAGAGIWATAAVDEKSDYAFVGTGNPYGPTKDYRTANSILKIDIDRGRKTFGEIVDVYKGDVDQWLAPLSALTDTPVCTAGPATIDYPQCGQLDLDFGASPNLYRSDKGDLIVGSLQKSGTYHAVYTDTMSEAWTTLMGLPCFPCNAGTTATDGKSVFGVGTPGGLVMGIEGSHGNYQWVTPIGEATHYQATSVANGVVYAIDAKGMFYGFDATTGAPVVARSMGADVSDGCSTQGGGIAIARNTVFISCDTGAAGGSWLVGYGLD